MRAGSCQLADAGGLSGSAAVSRVCEHGVEARDHQGLSQRRHCVSYHSIVTTAYYRQSGLAMTDDRPPDAVDRLSNIYRCLRKIGAVSEQ